MGEFLMLWLSKQKNFEDKHGLCFSEVPAASTAVRQMQSFLFYDKPMRIQYEKTKSDCLAKADGTFVPREKKERQEEKAAEKRRKAEEGHGPAANGSNAQSNGGPSAAQASHGQSKSGQREETAPNSILFIQNLPHEKTSMMLQILFQQYPGFKEVRMIEAKPGIAFVEFEDDMQASIAMQALQGFKITPQNPMAIAYAKK